MRNSQFRVGRFAWHSRAHLGIVVAVLTGLAWGYR